MAVIPAAIVDTGPLVAFFDRSHRHHDWVWDEASKLRAPLLVCEAVLSETLFLLARFSDAQDSLFGLLERRAIALAFHIEEHISEIRQLLRKYSDRPMSLADACIVRMAETHEGHAVFTLDSDFTIYRKNGRTPIDLIFPSMN